MNRPINSYDAFGLIACPVVEEEVEPGAIDQPDRNITNVKGDTRVFYNGTWSDPKSCGLERWSATYTSSCKTIIRYVRPKNQTKLERHGRDNMTVEEHENIHKVNGESIYTDVDNERMAFSGKCLCRPCFDALQPYFQAHRAVQEAYQAQIDAEFDCNQYSPGPGRDQRCKDAATAAGDWAAKSQQYLAAYNALVQACGPAFNR